MRNVRAVLCTQSYVPCIYQQRERGSKAMRHTRSADSVVSRTSHSSRHQLASDHHCPLTRHGPAISRTAYLCPSQKTRVGVLSVRTTPTACGGRETRSAVGTDRDCFSLFAGGGGANGTMRNAFGL